jgi:hypothetical protein
MVPSRTPQEEACDLAVVGAGLAGTCAAVSAARRGLRVALINDRPVLGGNSSTEIRVHVGGADSQLRWAWESGIIEEIRIEDRFRNYEPIISGAINQTWNQVLWEWVTREDSLDLYLNTSAREAVMDGNRIAAVLCDQLGTEKTIRIKADLFIDSSGDGAIAHSAGAEFRMGRESRDEFGEEMAPEVADRKTMGASLLFKAIDVGRPVKYERPEWAYEFPSESDLPFRIHERLTTGYWWIELGGEQDTVADNESVRDELWKSLYGVWDHIKNKGDHGGGNLALEWVGAVPGKRESRRFMGDYIMRQQDVESMASFPDAVAYGGWPIDIHPPGGIRTPEHPADMRKLPGPYSIPFRSLYSRNIQNLMMAGRNISVTHVALGTTRLQATGAVEGQAVGTAAHLCKEHGLMPRELHRDRIGELQQLLLKNDCYIPGVRNQDPGDLARLGSVHATSDMPLQVTDLHSFTDLDTQVGQVFPVTFDQLEGVELYLRSEKEVPVTIRVRGAKHWTDHSSCDDLCVATSRVPAGQGWVSFDTGAGVGPGYAWILLDPSPGVGWGFSKEEPIGVQRTEAGTDRRLGGSNLFKTNPVSRPYVGSNVISGVSRPEEESNLWVSDPGLPLPQSLELTLPSEVSLAQVRLTFDTDTDDLVPVGPQPKCARAYELHLHNRGKWRKVVGVTENHHRAACHTMDGLGADGLRLDILRTWGSPSARVYEIRAYGG